MTSQGKYRGLELRLRGLARRIAILQWQTRSAEGVEKLEELGEIEQLKRRYASLERRLEALRGGEPGVWQDIKAELARAADDLSATMGDFLIRLDHAQSVAGQPERRGLGRRASVRDERKQGQMGPREAEASEIRH